MDFRDAVITALDKHIAAGHVVKCIEDKLADTIKRVVDDALSQYSAFGKQLESAVKESLALNGQLDLPSYNDAILKIVRRQVEGAANDAIQRQVADSLTKLLEPPPAEITLSKLVEEYIEQVKGHADDYGESGEISLIVDKSDSGYGFSVELDEEGGKRKYGCQLRLNCNKAGEIYGIRINNVDLEKQLFVGTIWGFERSLFQMHAAKTRLVLDKDASEIETTWEKGWDE